MAIFTKNQKINVRIFFIDNNVSIRTLEAEEAKATIEKKEKGESSDVVNVLNTVWKNLSWKDNTDVINESKTVNTATGDNEINVFKFREQRLKRCLIEWDLKDEKGVTIVITPEIIDELDSDFALALLNAFDKKRAIGSEAEKK